MYNHKIIKRYGIQVLVQGIYTTPAPKDFFVEKSKEFYWFLGWELGAE